MDKNKKILTIVVGILVLATIAGVFVLKTSNKDVNLDNEDIEVIDPQDEVKNYLFNLTFDFKADLEDKYVLDLKDEKITINTEDITPEVNTGELGQTQHTINVDDKEITLVIDIIDNRTIELNNTSIEVEVGTSLDKIKKQIYFELIIDNLEDVEYEINTDNLDLSVPGENEVDLFIYYTDNELNNANIKIKVVVVEDVDLDRSDVVEKPRTEDPRNEESRPEQPKPEPKPEQPKPEPEQPKPEPKPKQPKPTESKPKPEPKPEQPKPAEPKPKPEQPKPDTGKARYPLTNPGSIPSGAKLTNSEINTNEEFHEYSYSKSLSGQGSINEVYLNFSNTVGREVNINGTDVNGELLFYVYNIDTGKVQYDWKMPELTSEDKVTLKSIAKQFAAAYGQ